MQYNQFFYFISLAFRNLRWCFDLTAISSARSKLIIHMLPIVFSMSIIQNTETPVYVLYIIRKFYPQLHAYCSS